jgi:hypothetical protein
MLPQGDGDAVVSEGIEKIEKHFRVVFSPADVADGRRLRKNQIRLVSAKISVICGR